MSVAKVGIGLLVLALVGVLVWAIVGQSRWEDRCRAAGGRIEERFEGFMTVYIGNPPVPYMQPQYSSHCWVAGHEVNV